MIPEAKLRQATRKEVYVLTIFSVFFFGEVVAVLGMANWNDERMMITKMGA